MMTTTSSIDDKRLTLKKNIKYLVILVFLFFLSIGLFWWAMVSGIFSRSLADAWDAIFNYDPDNSEHLSARLRFYRLIAMVITGAGLAVAGLLMQSVTRNALASPSVMGVSSAISLSTSIFAVFFATTSLFLIFSWMMLFAFIPMLIIFAVMKLSGGRTKGVYLAFLGIAIGIVMSSIQWFVMYNQDQSGSFVQWLLNSSFSNITIERLIYFGPVVGITLLVNLVLYRKYALLEPGDEFSQSVGNSVKFIRTISLISVGILVPAAMMVGGNIMFIGLIVPHITKLVFKTKNYAILIIATMMFGIILLFVSQILSSHVPLNVSAFIDLLAAPAFILLARRL